MGFVGLGSIRGVGSQTLSSIAANGRTFNEVFENDDTDDVLRYLRQHGARVAREAGADWRSARDRALARAAAQLDQFAHEHVNVCRTKSSKLQLIRHFLYPAYLYFRLAFKGSDMSKCELRPKSRTNVQGDSPVFIDPVTNFQICT